MYLAFLDEADHTKSKNFTICGLTAVKAESANSLSTDIERLRRDAGLAPTDTLKAASRNLPEGFSREQHRDLKNALFKTAQKHHVVFLGYAYLNTVSRTFDPDRNRFYGFNTLLGKFDAFLHEKKSMGTVTFDRLDISKSSVLKYKDGFEYLREKFQKGNEFQNNGFSPIKNVLAYSMTCEGASHFSSLNDVLTGSLRYVVNEDKREVRKKLQGELQQLMWRDENGVYRNKGMNLRPAHRNELDPNLSDEYNILREFLNS